MTVQKIWKFKDSDKFSTDLKLGAKAQWKINSKEDTLLKLKQKLMTVDKSLQIISKTKCAISCL